MSRPRLWLLAKSLLAAALVAAVGRYFWKLLQQPELRDVPIALRPEYLLPAGLLYLLTHTLWGTFWVQLLRGQGVDIPWRVGVRAYFVSQFGKYVPGKAWVVFLRIALLRGHAHPMVVGVTGVYETLTSMAAGALLGFAFLPWAGQALVAKLGAAQWWLLAALAGMPLGVVTLHKLAARIAAKYRAPDARPLAVPTVRLLVRGLVQNAVGWFALGLSLWLTVRGTLGESGPLLLFDYLQDLAAVCLSYVAGFLLIVSPGGLGARELVLQTMLKSQFVSLSAGEDAGMAAAGLAAVVALVLRLVWTAAEVVAAALLWVAVRPPKSQNNPPAAAPTPPEAAVSP